jgi:FemAB-related protein (PEP-CTERM system-associated)
MRSRLFGSFLVSMPFFSYGGVLADDDAVRDQLLAAAVDLAHRLNANDIEIRQGDAVHCSWVDRTPKVDMRLILASTSDGLWAQLTRQMRYKIRSARKHGLEVQCAGKEAVPDFYRIFSRNMRDLGTPTYPQSWFENIFAYCPDGTRILLVCDKSEPVAAGIITAYEDTVDLPWAGSTHEARKWYSTVLLYWSAAEWAQQNGFHQLDLGRCTPGGGPYQFKHHFGCEEQLLHWYFWLAPGVPVPELRPDNPKFRLATQVWRRLPVSIANLVGPQIVRAIP